MPRRNVIKEYAAESYYHIYNRGVAGQTIFCDASDYQAFLSFLELSLKSPKDKFDNAVLISRPRIQYANFFSDIELLCYCLLPNHFHFLVYQRDRAKSISELMRSVMVIYVNYFNKRHKRSGPLFESIYKAVRISSEPQLLHITRYIHLNSLDVGQPFDEYPYSSYAYYATTKNSSWLRPERITSLFNGKQDYEKFIRDYIKKKRALDALKQEMKLF